MAANVLPLFGCIATVIVLVSADCLNGWTQFDDACYRVFENKKIWPEAQFECEKHDAFLAVIETKQESTNIHALVKELNFGSKDNIWIGLSDVRHETEWVWENSKQNATFFDWGHNEPNQKGTTQQDCVMLYGNVGHQWADVPCGESFFYLCERSVHSPILVG